jgi:hypothetical protein
MTTYPIQAVSQGPGVKAGYSVADGSRGPGGPEAGDYSLAAERVIFRG